MIVYLKPIGDLQDYFGRDELQVEMSDKCRVKDLLDAIQDRWGATLPDYMWDSKLHRFRGPIYLITDSRILDKVNTILHDQQEIKIMKALAGG